MAKSDDEVLEAKLTTIEAKTDTKITRLEGHIDTLAATLSGKLDQINQTMNVMRQTAVRDHDYNRTTRWVIVGLVVALFVGVITLLSYAGDQWGRGLSTRDLIQSTIKDYEAQKLRGNDVGKDAAG